MYTDQIFNTLLVTLYAIGAIFFIWFALTLLIFFKIKKINQKINYLIGDKFDNYYRDRNSYKGY